MITIAATTTPPAAMLLPSRGFLILALTTATCSPMIVGCLGFASSSSNNGKGRRVETTPVRVIRSPSEPSSPSSSSWSLFGLANVNDYFASFQNNNDDDDRSDNEGERGHKKEGGGRRYVGHGRMVNDDDDGNVGIVDDQGGAFDVNNYFDSFAQNADDDDVGATSDAPGKIIDEHASRSSSSSFAPQNNNDERKIVTHEEIVARNDARLCPKNLLTQMAVQSFIYVLEECRDPHSGKWIEDFLGLQNLGNYHGTGAIDVTKYPVWDDVLYDMMQQPNEKMIVSAKRRGRGHGGWSKNNPYLQERWVEFKIDIRPASIVQRLLPVREQIAEEFEKDLDVVGMVDAMIMDSYFTKLRDEAGTLHQSSGSMSGTAFDRISYPTISNFTEFQDGGGGSSPFRRGNFDLLYSLCTQASAHRLLRELRESPSSEKDVTARWFKKFYVEQAPAHFDGDQGFGRADDFVEAVLRTPPSVEMTPGEPMGVTDPLRIAERLIAIRSEIAMEWKGAMREVKQEHAKLNDVLFRVMMGRTMEDSKNEIVEIKEERTWEELSDSTGSFE